MKMNKYFIKKLRSSIGETLAETLVSVLLISIMSVGFLTMIQSANNMNEKAKKYDEDVDHAEVELAKSSGSEETTTATFKTGTTEKSFPVNVVTATGKDGNANVTLYSYEYEVTEEDEE